MGEIQDDLKDIKELLYQQQQQKKQKKFKIPFGARVKPAQAKRGFVTVMKINENGFVDFKKEQIEEQTIMVDGVPRLATPDYICHWKKNPMVIQPSWSIKPFSPADSYEKSMTDNTNIKGYKLLMNKMKLETISSKKTMGKFLPWIIGIGIAAVIGYALISGGGK